MKDLPGDRSSGNLRYKASSGTGGATSSPAQGGSTDTSPGRIASPAQRFCIIDGGVLLETEHVLLRTAPHLLACTARIRREGRIRLTGESLRVGFHLYEISVPIEAIRQIIGALKSGTAAYGSEHHALQNLIEIWTEIHGKCSD